MRPYRFLKEADAEFQEQIRYYDEQVSGLGEKFVADVDNIITQIRRHPESGTRVSGNLRKRLLTVFSHNILYFDSSDGVIIVAVAPHKRRPGYWRGRLKSR